MASACSNIDLPVLLQDRGALSKWALSFFHRDGGLPWEQQGNATGADVGNIVEVQAEVSAVYMQSIVQRSMRSVCTMTISEAVEA